MLPDVTVLNLKQGAKSMYNGETRNKVITVKVCVWEALSVGFYSVEALFWSEPDQGEGFKLKGEATPKNFFDIRRNLWVESF